MKVTILGSGASSGVPSIEAGWGDCDPDNPKNRRSRPSVLIERADKTILIDTSPDLREQLLRTGTQRLDAVVMTHGHADHLHGIDDIRSINRRMGAAIDLWADRETLTAIEERFDHDGLTRFESRLECGPKSVDGIHPRHPDARSTLTGLDETGQPNGLGHAVLLCVQPIEDVSMVDF